MAGQTIDCKKQCTKREYELYLATKADCHHFPVEKTRRCFIIQNQYFQLDIYKKPNNERYVWWDSQNVGHNLVNLSFSRCSGLVLLETYSSLPMEELKKGLPPFLRDVVDVTGKPEYSMFNLSLRDESYDAKFYKYAAAHGNKQQPPTSFPPLNGHNKHTLTQSNGCENRPTSTSPSSDDILMTFMTSNANCNVSKPAPAANGHECRRQSNGFNSSGGSSASGNPSNGCSRMNGANNGHVHLD